jgi:uncharacterized damage-inducible protein DinB
MKPTEQHSWSTLMDRRLIDEYERGGEKVAQAIKGLTREDMLAVPGAEAPADVGRWSVQQIILHLMDADLIWAARIKCMIAEQNPTIIGYDESKFAASLFYEEQDANEAVRILDLNRRGLAKVLRKLPDSAFNRTGQHNERGTITVAQSVQGLVQHVEHHVKFIHKKRAWMGKEMW